MFQTVFPSITWSSKLHIQRSQYCLLWNVASCWLYSANILALHGPVNVTFMKNVYVGLSESGFTKHIFWIIYLQLITMLNSILLHLVGQLLPYYTMHGPVNIKCVKCFKSLRISLQAHFTADYTNLANNPKMIMPTCCSSEARVLISMPASCIYQNSFYWTRNRRETE